MASFSNMASTAVNYFLSSLAEGVVCMQYGVLAETLSDSGRGNEARRGTRDGNESIYTVVTNRPLPSVTKFAYPWWLVEYCPCV